VSAIVLHATDDQGNEAGTLEEVTSPKTQKSYHAIVQRSGLLVLLVMPDRRAWHAGVSILEGVANVNDYSLGLAFANRNDGREAYTPAQLETAARLVRTWLDSFPAIAPARIVSHASVALPPGRRVDPLGFDHSSFLTLVQGEP
jgi:AmpD protein